MVPLRSLVAGALLALALPPQALAQTQQPGVPSVVGNCVSARHNFTDRSRVAAPAASDRRGAPPLIDYTVYDWTIDFAKDLVTFGANGGVLLSVMPKDSLNPNGASSRLSTTRYMLYGKVSARIKAPPQSGFVTSFITMSDIGDEIDWELVQQTSQTNVFYHQAQNQPPWNLPALSPENAMHYSSWSVPSFGDWHIYTIEWKHNEINWYVDQVLYKTFTKSGDGMQSPQVSSGLIPFWYPVTPSQIQFALWDAGDNPGTAGWAGAPDWSNMDPTYGRYAIFEYVDIQCYDDNDSPVPKWPADTVDNRQGNGVIDPPMNADGSVPGVTNPLLTPSTNTSNLPPPSAQANLNPYIDPATLYRPMSTGTRAIPLAAGLISVVAAVLMA
ncbi:concanavalin A-like lectin/glucanase domain-containing protein [Polychytrium aggregatum]|uniref:concanavalin A-like lectin/glucanase domain-containing protein n=1 Tax=Polychytrium aggregatum TaxID=110093 RepID=UPI0022FEEA49|nr:concanavalin A-like lectin/glucanase domain-containing protein [Polychytrium aggregatum]KAI9202133.1 concanavalin A-like lectin/glucanase domain-containing protein [Polychytrium aggregatum]